MNRTELLDGIQTDPVSPAPAKPLRDETLNLISSALQLDGGFDHQEQTELLTALNVRAFQIKEKK